MGAWMSRIKLGLRNTTQNAMNGERVTKPLLRQKEGGQLGNFKITVRDVKQISHQTKTM